MEENIGEIPNHTHCRTCAKAIPPDKTFCSEECKQRYMVAMKKQKRSAYIMFGIFAAVIVVMIVLLILPP
jgi:predicted nucleic acid-binding Zn ribbon protein